MYREEEKEKVFEASSKVWSRPDSSGLALTSAARLIRLGRFGALCARRDCAPAHARAGAAQLPVVAARYCAAIRTSLVRIAACRV